MKTKTGQLLMRQNKSKQSQHKAADETTQSKSVDETRQNNITLITLLKDQKQSQIAFKKEIRNKQSQGQDDQRLRLQYQNQLIAVKQQNNMMYEEIQRLNKQCSQLKIQVAQQKQLQQNTQHQEKSLKHNIQTQKQNSNNLSPPNSSSKHPQQQQQKLLKLQQKLSALQVQNYRLIESNYLLLINFKKNMKSYKESLLKIANMLQNLQFGQASKEIYHSLAKLKGEEGCIEGKLGMVVKEEDKAKSKQTEIKDNENKENTTRKQVKKKLTLASCVSSSQHFIPQSIQQHQNSIQLNLRHLSSFNPRRQPSNSFHLISQPNSQSEKQLLVSKKLFNSQIHEPQLLQPNYTLFDNSIRDKMETTYWENGSFVNNKSGRQMTVHKCHGNSMQLYKMLVVQATAIEGFF